MKIKTKTLVDILEMSSQFLLKTTTNPIIANTYVYKEEDNLIFKSYNGINYVKVVVPFDWDLTSSYIPTFDILKILKWISEQDVEMWIEDNNIHFKAGKDRFKFKLIDNKDILPDPEPYGNVSKVVFKKWEFKKIVDIVWPFIPFKNIALGLTGMKMDIADWKISVAWSDGMKIIAYTDSFMRDWVDTNISKDVLSPISKINDLSDIEMEIAENYISTFSRLEGFDATIYCCTMSAKYPDYKNTMAAVERLEFEEITFNTKELQDAIKKVSLMANDINYSIMFDFYKDNKECSVKNAVEDKGKYQVVLSVLSDIKKDFKMVMSFKHLSEIIKAFDNQAAITIKYNISWLYLMVTDDNKKTMLRWMHFNS